MSYIHVPMCVQNLGLKIKRKHQEPNPNSQTRSNQTKIYNKIKVNYQNNYKNKIKNIEN